MYIPHAIDETNITLVLNNNSVVIPRSALNYNEIKKALLEQNYEAIHEIIDAQKALEIMSEGDVSCNGTEVTYKNEPIDNAASVKLLNLMSEGYKDIKPWLKFINKLMKNPSHNSRKQSYKFIEHKGMPLTEDGNIIGYKGVSDTYKDIYSGKFDNSVGSELSMQRSNVDDNINNGCSSGFHVGSHEYADAWASTNGKLMLVEFSPEDIVSVPHCSNYAKLRVAKYKVVSECFDRKMLNDTGVYGDNTTQYGSNEDIINNVNNTIFERTGSFTAVQRSMPGITVNEIIDAYQNNDETPPSFAYNDERNELVVISNCEELDDDEDDIWAQQDEDDQDLDYT